MEKARRKNKKIYFKICEKLISKVNIIRIYNSKVIERYYNINHSTKGKTIYYPSIFENKKIETKIKNKERFYIIGRLLEENNTEMIVKAFAKLDISKKLILLENQMNILKIKLDL